MSRQPHEFHRIKATINTAKDEVDVIDLSLNLGVDTSRAYLKTLTKLIDWNVIGPIAYVFYAESAEAFKCHGWVLRSSFSGS